MEVIVIKRNEKLGKVILFFIFYMGLGVFILSKLPTSVERNEFLVYITIILAYYFIGSLLFFSYVTKGLDVLEPIVFVSAIYLMLFVFAPIINITKRETLWFDIDLMGGGVKATIIFMISYLAFYIGYYKTKAFKKVKGNVEEKTLYLLKADSKPIVFINITIWLFCFICSLGYLITNGMNISYILSLGAAGEVGQNTQSPFGFLNMFSYSLIPTFMYIFIFSTSKVLKIILGLLTSIIFIVNGFRFILLIFILAPIIYFYIEKNKRPRILSLSIFSILIIVMTGTIGFTRDQLRSGGGFDLTGFNLEYVIDAIKGNFDIYNTFYGAVQAIPSIHEYTWGEQMAYTLIMFIPRFLWPSKPEPVLNEVIAASVSNYANAAGTAWPNIGEFYTEFGVIGCLIIMYFFGWFCGKSRMFYLSNERNIHSLIAYSILLPAFFQLIIRGYTPSNFYLVVFLLLPVLLNKKMNYKKNKNHINIE